MMILFKVLLIIVGLFNLLDAVLNEDFDSLIFGLILLMVGLGLTSI